MAKVIEYIKSLSCGDFISIKKTLTAAPFKLSFKETPDLYLLRYNKNSSNMDNDLVKQCRGIILEKNTNRVVNYSFNACISYPDLIESNNNDFSRIMVEEAIDGIFVNLYYYDDKWNLATSHSFNTIQIEAIYNSKSIYTLFREASADLDYTVLNKLYCYSFIINHPDYRIVTKYNKPAIIHIYTTDLTTLKPVNATINKITKPVQIEFSGYNDMVIELNRLPYDAAGFILTDNNYNICKITGNTYSSVKKLRGSGSIHTRLAELTRQPNLVAGFLNFYSEYTAAYENIKNSIDILKHEIYTAYRYKYITSLNLPPMPIAADIIPYLSELHKLYIYNKYKRNPPLAYPEITQIFVNNFIDSISVYKLLSLLYLRIIL